MRAPLRRRNDGPVDSVSPGRGTGGHGGTCSETAMTERWRPAAARVSGLVASPAGPGRAGGLPGGVGGGEGAAAGAAPWPAAAWAVGHGPEFLCLEPALVALCDRARAKSAALGSDRRASGLRPGLGDLGRAAGAADVPAHRGGRAGGLVQPAGGGLAASSGVGCLRALPSADRAVLGSAGWRRGLRLLTVRNGPQRGRAAEPDLHRALAADRLPPAAVAGRRRSARMPSWPC